MAGRYSGSYLRRLTDWRVVAILADIGELHSSDASHLDIPYAMTRRGRKRAALRSTTTAYALALSLRPSARSLHQVGLAPSTLTDRGSLCVGYPAFRDIS